MISSAPTSLDLDHSPAGCVSGGYACRPAPRHGRIRASPSDAYGYPVQAAPPRARLKLPRQAPLRKLSALLWQALLDVAVPRVLAIEHPMQLLFSRELQHHRAPVGFLPLRASPAG